jgi:hypothetical protein
MLDKLVNGWVGLSEQLPHAEASAINKAAEIYKQGLSKQYQKQPDSTYVRVSNLGRPGLDIHAHRLHPKWFTNDKTERLIQLFHNGDTFEADFYFHLYRFGYKIKKTQVEVNYRGVLGHTDMVVVDNDVETLLELKTCSANRFSQLSKGQENMPLTYLTQMAVYQKCLGIPACWVIYNKDNSEIAVVPYSLCQKTIDRADYLIDSLAEVDSWEKAYDWFVPPPPEPEKFKNSLTGNFKVPQCVDRQLAPHLYDVVETLNGYKKMTQYVVSYRNWDGSVYPLED